MTVKIKRTIANKILSRASSQMDRCLVALMDDEQAIIYADCEGDINQLVLDHPKAILIYNQNPDALKIKDKIEYSDGQQCIEIFQDTEGVTGLRAYLQVGKIQTPVILELSDD